MSAPGTTVAVRDKREKLRAQLAAYAPSLQELLPDGYSPQELITGALIAVQANPALLDCTPVSIATALGRIAQWGLQVGTTAHLVPFGKVCTPIADYKGLIELMVAAGGARKVEAQVVREGDGFEYAFGTEQFLQHRPKAQNPGPITHAYAIVWLRGGVTQFEVMTAADIDAIRHEKSRSWKQGPLTSWYARKTVVRQVAKYVPRNPRLAQALATDDTLPDLVEAPVTDELLRSLERTRIAGPPAVAHPGYGEDEGPPPCDADGVVDDEDEA